MLDEATRTIRKPNLLIILVDQMRHMAMGCAGNDQVNTPRLDEFAREGASMDCAISNSPVCTPARACLLTGRYPLSHTTLTNNSMLPPDMPSMGKMLRNEGYATGYIGKWHLAGEGYIGATKYNEGHQGYIPPGEMRHGFDYWAVHHCSHSYKDACYYLDDPEPIHIDGWEPDVQTDLAIDFMRSRAPKPGEESKPFFLTLSPGTPHTPFMAPAEFESMYNPDTVRFRDNVQMSDLLLKCDSPLPHPDMTDPEEVLRIFTARYWAAVSNLDWNFGRLLDALDDLELTNDTIVVFTSDHGDLLGSHGQMHKTVPYEESIRIPFLIRYPNHIPAGLLSCEPFGLTDTLPTLFSLMGISIPSGIEGADFCPVLTGESTNVQDSAPILWPCNAVSWGKRWTDLGDHRQGSPRGFRRPYRGIRTRTHTYVRDLAGPWMLYDNEADPYQMQNLIEEGRSHAIPPELENMLNEWLERTGDTFEDTAYYRDCINLETGLVIDRAGF